MKDDRAVDPRVEPYTKTEWDAICAAYPDYFPRNPPRGVLAAARQYVESRLLEDENAIKPNAHEEIRLLAKWVREGCTLTLGHQAREHLASNKQARPFPTHIDQLVRCVFAIESEYREALRNLPPAPTRGPKAAIAEERLIYELRKVWPPDRKGWWAFFRLCTDPLKKHGLQNIADNKDWGEKLTRAKKRWDKPPPAIRQK